MRETYRQDIRIPFSLHDMSINAFEVEGSEMIMRSATGLLHAVTPCRQVNGYVKFEGVQWDFSYVYLLNFTGNEGSFTGEKMLLKNFIEKYPALNLCVIDETYGYNMTKYTGYLSSGNRLQECTIEIYHEGFMTFIDETEYEGMEEVILSHDSELLLYSVPAEVAAYLDEYCLNFASGWVWHGPENQKYLHSFGDGQLGAMFGAQDFIDYLNKWEFPDRPSKLIKNLGCYQIPEAYRDHPHFNF